MPSSGTGVIVSPSPQFEDLIPSLVTGTPFKLRSTEERLFILQRGRPIPKLNIVKRDEIKKCNRSFKETWYQSRKWLCGSPTYNKLFCWPCLLMRPESSSWCTTGSDDVKRLSTITSKHVVAKTHMKAATEFDETVTSFGLEALYSKDKQKEDEMRFFSSDDESEENSTESPETKKQKIDFTYQQNKVNTQSTLLAQASKSIDPNPSEGSNNSSRLSFKVWKELAKPSLPMTQNEMKCDSKLYRMKKKLMRKELRNATLVGEKLSLEIELLKAKLDYQNTINNEVVGFSKSLNGPNGSTQRAEVCALPEGEFSLEQKLQMCSKQIPSPSYET